MDKAPLDMAQEGEVVLVEIEEARFGLAIGGLITLRFLLITLSMIASCITVGYYNVYLAAGLAVRVKRAVESPPLPSHRTFPRAEVEVPRLPDVT